MRPRRVLWLLLATWLIGSGAWSENVVFNPGFDTDVSGWTVESYVSISWSLMDANLNPASGSAEVTNSSPGPQNGTGITQCLDITPIEGAAYDFGSKALIPDGQARTGSAQVGLRWWSGSNCTGSTVGTQPRRATSTLGAWVELSSTEQIAPAGAASAQFVAFPSKLEAGGSLVAHFDDLYFRNTPLFADGFESGDLTSWSSTTQPILTMTPYVNQSQIAGLWWPYCDSGDCPWEPPTQKHDGLDFTPNEDLVPFQAAAPGVVYEVALFENTGNDFWQVNVMVSCSPDNAYGLIYAFEPMTSSQADGEWQLDNIEVQAGTVVSPGDVIGSLYQGAEYAHVHFGIWENWQQTCPEPFLSTPVRTELRDLIQSEPGHEDWEICN